MNKWDLFRSFYSDYAEELETTPSNEWITQPRDWETEFCMTPIERWMWEEIRNNRMVMYPQYPVLGFFLDFANPKAKVAIECDGAAYHTDWQKDQARDKALNAAGWVVFRFTGSECWKEQDPETGNATDAQELLAAIAKAFPVQRKAKVQGWTSLGLAPGAPKQGAAV